MSTPKTVGPAAPRALPGLGSTAWARISWELRSFLRQREALLFTFGLPIGIYVLYAVTMNGELVLSGRAVDHDRYMLPGLAAAAVMLASFQSTALSVAYDRESGAIKRLRATPVSPTAFITGKLGLVLVVSVAQLVVLVAVATVAFDVAMPASWSRLAVTYALGIVAGTTCGIALGGALRNPASASTVVPGLTLLLQFVCGVFFVLSNLPSWLQEVAAWLPLTWLARGMRSAFLPENLAAAETGGTWNLPATGLVLVAWAVLGLLASRRVIRWRVR